MYKNGGTAAGSVGAANTGAGGGGTVATSGRAGGGRSSSYKVSYSLLKV